VPAYTRLSSPIQRLAYRYDAVVIGSGYGASISAARLAQAGLSVCVLERGREWVPGEFPTDEPSVMAAIKTPLNPLGLIDPNTQLANDLDVVVGNGLGGTSLINAGISLRPENVVFEQPEWPAAIRRAWQDGSLSECFARAETVLGARTDPQTSALPKVRAHGRLVTARGVHHALNPLNVSSDCTSCGDCVAGCNVGAKNNLAMTYLPLAKKDGATIFTEIEVRRLEATHEGDWIVEFELVRGPLASSKSGSVRARTIVLGAGSLGSTEILMRSELPVSKTLGSRFSANADIMTMSYNGHVRTDVLGATGERDWRVGPTIASHGDYRRGPMEERFLLLEGAVPSALVALVSKAFGAYAMLAPGELTAEQRQRIQRDLLEGPTRDGALNHSLLFLACGHDSGNGRLVLRDASERVIIEWPDVEKERAFHIITQEMESVTRDNGGSFIPNPRSTLLGGGRQMTVHPLGGCPMGEDVDTGVVDDMGRVWSKNGGAHLGLFVADGAIVPRSLGVTPLLTISALTERATAAMISDHRDRA
jgi:cholesterol oxidase